MKKPKRGQSQVDIVCFHLFVLHYDLQNGKLSISSRFQGRFMIAESKGSGNL